MRYDVSMSDGATLHYQNELCFSQYKLFRVFLISFENFDFFFTKQMALMFFYYILKYVLITIPY